MASHPATTAQPSGRVALVRRGRQLAWFTIGWDALEGLVAIAAGLAAGSIALLSFGADSYVEVVAGSVVLWRLAAERRGQEVSEAAERRAVRPIAGTFFVLALGWRPSRPAPCCCASGLRRRARGHRELAGRDGRRLLLSRRMLRRRWS